MSDQDQSTQDSTNAEDAEAQELLADAVQSESQEDQQEAADGSQKKEPFDQARAEDKIRKANNEAANLRKRLKEYEDRDKTEQQKLEERAQTAEQKAAELETKATRAEVAAEKGVPAELLSGSTQEELEASADKLLEFAGPRKQSSPDLKQGQRGNQDKQRQVTRGELANMNNSEINKARREGRLDDVLAGRDK